MFLTKCISLNCITICTIPYKCIVHGDAAEEEQHFYLVGFATKTVEKGLYTIFAKCKQCGDTVGIIIIIMKAFKNV